ncbi:Splicing factor YJU2 [Heracleum sosnowskyi]|uniref:Splicing factor YJU2 n=1 Tax=Heracleum sosnowskyi TaxID=360622 RepID=A0AAD8IDH2_9APIA|nr:Splicing factor YJU2 [Heracleum sosnowskyi]KAK1381959.1 Splicing factor YJU2 [Heracleum sosnowskyi]
MGERKVVNKYIPPDFDPAKIPTKKIGNTKQSVIRTMCPMKIRCNSCGHYIDKGTKFNERIEEVTGKEYLGVIKIFRFYSKCSNCSSEIVMLTDPKNSDYVVESGGTRCFEPWREGDEEEVEVGDYMECLEKRSRDSKREMDRIAALHELKSMNSRRSKVSVDSLLEKLRSKEEEEKEEVEQLCAEDEAVIESRFRGGKGEFVRRIDDEDDWDEYPVSERLSNYNLKKRKVVSGEFTRNPTQLISQGSIFGSSKSKATSGTPRAAFITSSVKANICAVKKKTLNREEGTEKVISKDNRQGKSNTALQCLCKDYASDEET